MCENWSYRKAITFEYTKVDSLMAGKVINIVFVDLDLAKAQEDGDDILFTTYDGVTKISHEISSFDFGSSNLDAWANVPLSETENTIIYMCYGNNSASNQQNPLGVWSQYIFPNPGDFYSRSAEETMPAI